jgi:hypothetical protein
MTHYDAAPVQNRPTGWSSESRQPRHGNAPVHPLDQLTNQGRIGSLRRELCRSIGIYVAYKLRMVER